jgi:hypothetical protein
MENSTKLIRGLVIMKRFPKIPPKTKSTPYLQGKERVRREIQKM